MQDLQSVCSYKLDLITHKPKQVDITDGTSVCQHCGAVYAGCADSNETCRNVIPFVQWVNNSHYGWTVTRRFCDLSDNEKHYSNIKEFYYKECGSHHFAWSLQEEWCFYNYFCQFVNSIPTDKSHYSTYKKYLKPETVDLIISSLHDRVSVLEHRNLQLERAIRKIADKMNDAGDILRF